MSTIPDEYKRSMAFIGEMLGRFTQTDWEALRHILDDIAHCAFIESLHDMQEQSREADQTVGAGRDWVDLAVGEPGEAAAGDGDMMVVTAEIGEHQFEVEDPFPVVNDPFEPLLRALKAEGASR